MDGGNIVVLLTVTLMLLYGIAGAYQPSVQASIPVLVEQSKLIVANSIINTVSSLAALIGPVLEVFCIVYMGSSSFWRSVSYALFYLPLWRFLSAFRFKGQLQMEVYGSLPRLI